MALETTSSQEIAAFIAKKKSQWERLIAPAGAQMIQSGERGTQFMMASTVAVTFEGVVYGQMPQIVRIAIGSRFNPVIRPATEKPFEKSSIDLNDDQILAVLDAWKAGTSALGLPGVPAVYRDGVLHTQT